MPETQHGVSLAAVRAELVTGVPRRRVIHNAGRAMGPLVRYRRTINDDGVDKPVEIVDSRHIAVWKPELIWHRVP